VSVIPDAICAGILQ